MGRLLKRESCFVGFWGSVRFIAQIHSLPNSPRSLVSALVPTPSGRFIFTAKGAKSAKGTILFEQMIHDVRQINGM